MHYRYGYLLLLAFIIAGVAGNYLKFTIFLNIDFIFGSIFAMLALQFFGLGRGVIAGTIIAGYTYFLWNHPYSFIIMSLEVLVVGLLMERRKIGMVLADALYWLFIGMPLVYLFFHLVMHIPLSNASIVMTKQAVNGIANALVARLIFTGFIIRSKSSLISYREIIYNLLAFFVLCPALVLMAVSSRTDFSETDLHIRTSLVMDSHRNEHLLETWVKNRKTSILNLAEMAALKSPRQMQPYLEMVKKSDVNFMRIGLIDSQGISIAYSPEIDEMGHDNIGKNFADRPFLSTLQQTLKPMLSDVEMSRVGTPKPRVLMLAPVVVRGGYGGFATGALDLGQIRELLDKSTENNATLYSLLDKNGNVIMSNRTDQKMMTPFVRGVGKLKRIDADVSFWTPSLSHKTPSVERLKKAVYVSETAIGDLAEWKLILEQPVAPFHKILYDSYSGKLTLLFAVLLGALVLAELLSRRSIITLEKLRLITRDLPTRLSMDGKVVTWPESSVLEANHLISNFREMADSLSQQLIETRHINETLEKRVEERTSELKDSEERQRAILQSAMDGFWTLDMQGVLLEVNDTYCRMSGYSKQELLSMRISDLDAVEASVDTETRIKKIIADGEALFESRHRRKDGTFFDVEVCVQYRNIEGGRFVVFIRDISERKQAEEERLSLERQLLQAQKMESLGVLAGGIAHDFNNILTAIVGNTELALMRLNPESPVLDNLKRIEKGAVRATDLAKQMLAYSGKGKFVVEAIDINRLVEEMGHMLEVSISKKAVLRYNLAHPLPSVEVDATQIRQIIMNLVINASEAIGDRSGVIAVTTGCINCDRNYLKNVWLNAEIPEGLYVFFEVADTGCGMDKETRAKIFDPFFTTKFTGRGLGMAAVQGIVKGHKGAINVYSEPGKGSSFKILLPAGTMPAELFNGEPDNTEFKGEGVVLLVDDEETVLGIGSEMLREFGFTVITANDGREAVEAYKANPGVYCVILDLTMPHLDGEQTFRELRMLDPNVKVIMSSGYSEYEVTQKFAGKGLAGFIQKPYKMSTLREVIRGVG
jgi:PAS domain S-box-containing protein